MVVRTRVDSVATEISLLISSTLTPAAQAAAFASYAGARIAEADERNKTVLGRTPPKVITVDGARGAELGSVRPGGSIVAEWELHGELLRWIGDKLRDRSPVVSGNYRRGHTLFADGVEVPFGGQIPIADEYIFINPLPYARKIEIGKLRSGRSFVIQVPNRIYERTAKDAAARFGNLARIKFGYRAPSAGKILAGNGSRGRSAGKQFERALRVPSIVITLKAV